MRIAFLFFLLKGTFLTASMATPSISIGIEPINEIALERIPPISLPSKSQKNSCVYKGSYSITTNETQKKITASLSSPLPNNTTLSMQLKPPKGASSAGEKTISEAETLLVSNISKLAESNLEITYSLHSSGPCLEGSYLKVVTLTLTD